MTQDISMMTMENHFHILANGAERNLRSTIINQQIFRL